MPANFVYWPVDTCLGTKVCNNLFAANKCCYAKSGKNCSRRLKPRAEKKYSLRKTVASLQNKDIFTSQLEFAATSEAAKLPQNNAKKGRTHCIFIESTNPRVLPRRTDLLLLNIRAADTMLPAS